MTTSSHFLNNAILAVAKELTPKMRETSGLPVHEPSQWSEQPWVDTVVQLEGYSEFVTDISLAVVSGDIVDFSIEVECEDISHAGVHGQVGQGKVRCRLWSC